MSKVLTQGFFFNIPNTQYSATAYSLSRICTYFVLHMDKKTNMVFDLGAYVPEMNQASYIFCTSFEPDTIQGLFALCKNSSSPKTIFTKHVEQISQLVSLYQGKNISVTNLPSFQALPNSKLFASFIDQCIVIAQEKLTSKAVRELKKAQDKQAFLADKSNYEYKPVITYAQTLPTNEQDLKLIMQSELLICSCEADFKGYLEYDTKNAHPFTKFASTLGLFTGKQILLTKLPERIVCDGFANLNMYLVSRLPPSVCDKVTLVPHRENVLQHVAPINGTIPATFPEYQLTELNPNEWQIQEFVGYIGSKKEEIRAKWKAKYPSGYTLAYVVPRDENGTVNMDDPASYMIIERKSAFLLYEDGYMAFFKKFPQIVTYLCNHVLDVYDTEPENVLCGFDYENQDDKKATHLQDIAIRRAMKRLGHPFAKPEKASAHLMHVRGYTSEGYFLNPGQVPFHKPHWIKQPEYALDFMIPGSIESFWQSNKVLITKK